MLINEIALFESFYFCLVVFFAFCMCSADLLMYMEIWEYLTESIKQCRIVAIIFSDLLGFIADLI